jgi:hypothetical protein
MFIYSSCLYRRPVSLEEGVRFGSEMVSDHTLLIRNEGEHEMVRPVTKQSGLVAGLLTGGA